ncbi:hypothetical protein [Burkholderia contaminans]|uniref:hypothetical protein n=1 Tax=Burkholderia contaminans TaxID=488447 RepID=UPI001452E766|nr:hypothetical protein [Burkholderia contaminans]VWD20556.1 hypothetical protein BCO18442_03885 [Burkholderia contaminans]
MAGDWIKMRTNLWDDPRISNLCDLTGCSEAAVIGGLYWLWATADDHSADGEMYGLTMAAIARKTGVPNLGTALRDIGWIEEIEGGIRLIRFNEHNGTSAKKRAQTGKRVATHRSNADVTHGALQDDESGVTGALAREEKRREEAKTTGTVIASGKSARVADDDYRPKDAAEWLRHLHDRHGFEADPTNVNDRKKLWPVFAGWTNAGLTTAFLDAAIAVAIRDAKEPIVCLPLYVDRCMANANAARASPQPNWSDQNAETIAALTGRNRSHEPDDRTIDV